MTGSRGSDNEWQAGACALGTVEGGATSSEPAGNWGDEEGGQGNVFLGCLRGQTLSPPRIGWANAKEGVRVFISISGRVGLRAGSPLRHISSVRFCLSDSSMF